MVTLRDIAAEYVDFQVAGKHLSVPYATSHNPTPAVAGEGRTSPYANYGGKGDPDQIRRALIKVAGRSNLNLQEASVDEIQAFMLEHGIGIDCSGFVYNVLDKHLRSSGQIGMAARIYRFSGVTGRAENLLLRPRRARRSSASTLTSDLNTVKITRVADIRPGDMMRLTHATWSGKHIAVIVDVASDAITYAHSSVYTGVTGTHFGQIKITDKNLGLESQSWLEQTTDGHDYGEVAFVPARGDSVRRLKGR